MANIVAWLFGLGLLGNALLFLPQALELWRRRSSEGLSLLSFAGFNLVQLIGAVHGYLQNDRPLLIGMLASLLTCGSVTVLILVYRLTGSRRGKLAV